MKKEILTLVIVAALSHGALAQDSQGRQRVPPSPGGESQSGSNDSGSSRGSSDSGSSRGSSDSSSSRGSSDSGSPSSSDSRSSGSDRAVSRGSSDSGSSSSGGGWAGGGGGAGEWSQPSAPSAPQVGGAIRRIPPSDRADAGSISTVGRGRNAPDALPTQDDRGRDLGYAVRRDSLPGRENSAHIREAGLDAQRHYHSERDYGRHYWHDYNGRRYSHYVDPDGLDWYLWYYDSDVYYTRYHGGRYWRYDSIRGRWCYLYDDYWIYDNGSDLYLNIGGRYNRYEESGGAVVLKPEAPADPNAVTDDVREKYYSTDQSRLVLVKKDGNAFMYFGSGGGSYFSGRFLSDQVVSVNFEYNNAAALRKINVVRTKGSKKFEPNGEVTRPLIDPMVNVQLGGSYPATGEDRGVDDVINRNSKFLSIDQGRLNGAFVGVEGLVGVGKYVEVGAGIGRSQGTVPTNYKKFTRPDGSEIKQEINLSNTQTTFTGRVVPWGRDKRVQPYFGAGVAVNKWGYKESGDYIDFAARGMPIYNETYAAQGSVKSPVYLGGVRVQLNDRVSINGEYRRSGSKDVRLDPSQGFAGNTLKVGGSQVVGGVTIRLRK